MDTLDITILMPMGGLGKRFVDAGYATPKPMITINGKPMFLRALESFPSSWKVRNVFVIRQDQEDSYGLSRLIDSACPNAQIAILTDNTRGTVETCLLAEDLIDFNLPVIIADCDTRFQSRAYIEAIESQSYDGVLAGFESSDARYSFAEVTDNGEVLKTAEKVPISTHALLGGYYFRSGELFLNLAKHFVSNDLGEGLKEFYVSHLYNMLLHDGGHVGFAEAEHFDIWGTPEELMKYLCLTHEGQ